MRKKILFFAEGVTFTHIGKPVILAKYLASAGYKVYLARDPRHGKFSDDRNFSTVDMFAQSTEQFADNINRGKPLFDYQTLKQYAETDLEILNQVKPDIVIGDLRFSLATSARKFDIPYVNLTHAYWHKKMTAPTVCYTLP